MVTSKDEAYPGNNNPCKAKREWPEPPAPESVPDRMTGSYGPSHGLSPEELYEWLVDVAATLLTAQVPANTFIDPRDNGLYVLCGKQHTELVEEVSRVSMNILKNKRIVREKLSQGSIMSFQCTEFSEKVK